MRYHEFKKSKLNLVIESIVNEVKMSPSALRKFATSDIGSKATIGFEAELDFPGMDFENPPPPAGKKTINYNTTIESIDEAASIFRTLLYHLSMYEIKNEIDDFIKKQAEDSRYNNDREYDAFVTALKRGSNYSDMVDATTNDGNLSRLLRSQIEDYHQDEMEIARNDVDDIDSLDDGSFIKAVLDSNKDKKYHILYIFFTDYRDEFVDIDSEISDIIYYEQYYQTTYGELADMFDVELPQTYSKYYQLIDKFIEETDGFDYWVSYTEDSENYTMWTFVRDGSLPSTTGVEIISPAMPINVAIDVLPKFFDWVQSNDGEATERTGFHISVSFPEYDLSDLDYVKMALFLGDTYVLDQFSRYFNEYANPSLVRINDKMIYGRTNDAMKMLAAFDSTVTTMKKIGQMVFSSRNTSSVHKYTSINPYDNRVEIRSAGGPSYLNDSKKITDLMARYAYALYLALDPEAEQKEYAKKLYVLLSNYKYPDGADTTDVLKIFSLYSAGSINGDELLHYIGRIKSEKELGKMNQSDEMDTPRQSEFIVKLNNPYINQMIKYTIRDTDYQKAGRLLQNIEFGGDGSALLSATPSETKAAVRREIKHIMDTELPDDAVPTITDLNGQRVKFDPMNRRHLRDNEITIVTYPKASS